MRTLLILENEMADSYVLQFQEQFPGSTILIEHLRYDAAAREALKEALKLPITDIYFKTTWSYPEMTATLYEMMKRFPRPLNFWVYSASDPCLEILKAIRLKTPEDYQIYLGLDRHRFYSLTYDQQMENAKPRAWITDHPLLEQAKRWCLHALLLAIGLLSEVFFLG